MRMSFAFIIKTLEAIAAPKGTPIYKVSSSVLNSKHVGGIPQHRPRLYIVGVTAAMQKSKFQFPTDVPMQPLTKFITGPAAAQGNLPGSTTHLKN